MMCSDGFPWPGQWSAFMDLSAKKPLIFWHPSAQELSCYSIVDIRAIT
jgi:hypothetical protein